MEEHLRRCFAAGADDPSVETPTIDADELCGITARSIWRWHLAA